MKKMGAVKVTTLVALTGGIATLAVLSFTTSRSTHATAAVAVKHVVSSADVKRWVLSLGLDPETLTAAGVTTMQLSTLVQQATDYLETHSDDLRQAQSAAAAALKAAASSKEPEQAASLKAAADAAVANRDTKVSAFFAATTNGLSAEVIAAIHAIKANRSTGLPMKFLVKNRSPEEWASIRDSMAALKTAADRGEPVPSEAESIVSTASNDPAVSAADSRLATSLAAMKTAFVQAFVSNN